MPTYWGSFKLALSSSSSGDRSVRCLPEGRQLDERSRGRRMRSSQIRKRHRVTYEGRISFIRRGSSTPTHQLVFSGGGGWCSDRAASGGVRERARAGCNHISGTSSGSSAERVRGRAVVSLATREGRLHTSPADWRLMYGTSNSCLRCTYIYNLLF